MYFSAFCLFALLAPSTQAQNYRAEIMREVIDPCLLAILARQGGIPGVSTSEALELLKIVQKQQTEQSIQALLPLMRGETREQRALLYQFGLRTCVNAGK